MIIPIVKIPASIAEGLSIYTDLFGRSETIDHIHQYSVDHKQSEMPAMRAFFTFPPTRSTESHGRSTNTLEPPAISARSKNEFPPKQERRITAFNQSCHYHIAIGMPYS